MKDLEAEFLEGLNAIIQEVNTFCYDTVREVIECFSFINRKLNVGEKIASNLQSLLSDEVATASLEIVRLDQFVQSIENILLELVRTNDSLLGVSSSPWFSARMQSEGFTNINFSGLILGLSEVYQNIREGLKKPDPTIKEAQEYKTKTAKFWVRKADMVKVKAIIVKHIPAIKWANDADVPIEDKTDSRKYTSVYMDNDKFTFYKQIFEEENGATQFRVEWYDEDSDFSYLEEKVFRDWNTNSTTDMRFQIKDKYIGPFLRGEWSYEALGQKLLKKGEINEEQYEETNKIASGMQKILVANEMKGVLRSEYQRCVYHDQNMGLRMVIDDDLLLFRERTEKGRWTKVANITSPKDQTQFPFAILQIKYVDKFPDWLEDFQRSSVLIRIEGHFSKFLYGIAKFYPDQLRANKLTIPPWFKSFEKSHRELKKRYGAWFFDKEKSAPVDPGEISKSKKKKKKKPSYSSSDEDELRSHGLVALDMEDDDDDEVASSAGLSRHKSLIQDDDDDVPLIGARKSKASKSSNSSADVSIRRLPQPPPTKPTEIKPVRVPIKVEPKTFFANERTLLQWLNSVVVLSTVALALIGLGDNSARLSGLIILPIALCFALYALVMYHIRRTSIREHKPSPAYDDKIGPYVLVFVFILATIVSVVVPALQYTPVVEVKTNNTYPFYPANLPFTPQSLKITAPLPFQKFENRSEAFGTFQSYLKALPHSYLFSFDEYSSIEQWDKVTARTIPSLSSCFVLTKEQTGALSFSILPNMPNFKTLPFPKVQPGYYGKSNFALEMTCKDTQLSYTTVVDNAPLPDTVESLETYFTNIPEVLSVNTSTSFEADPRYSYPSVYRWRASALLDNYVTGISLSVFYKTPSPGPLGSFQNEPTVEFELLFSAGGPFPVPAGTELLSRIIHDYWESTPVSCRRN
eukprot:TRINITY_DN1672_c0_g1_i1.p1 TRINITY_DN1672_c0_g1~~TRINITY_DN1672_c0_g1_i1.p1  ORF type:complete len:972 (+),score=260.36 TRINITY_DN1672_c0_g1_i1:160-2916(+)